MRPNAAAQRYAAAAYQVAHQDGNEGRWVSDLRAAGEAMENPDVAHYFRDPNFSQDEKMRTVERIFDGVEPHVMNLLRILVSRNRMHLLPAVAYNFDALHREALGIEEVHVTVARPLSEQQSEDVRRSLSEATGKRIELTSDVDERLIGGIVLRMGDRLIDASVSGRLEKLRQNLTT